MIFSPWSRFAYLVLGVLPQLALADPVPISRDQLYRKLAYWSPIGDFLERSKSEAAHEEDALAIIRAGGYACSQQGYFHGAANFSLEEIDWSWSELKLGFRGLSCASSPEEAYGGDLKEHVERVQVYLLQTAIARLQTRRTLENPSACQNNPEDLGLAPAPVERIGGGPSALEPMLLKEVLKGKIWVDLLPSQGYQLEQKCASLEASLQKGCKRLGALIHQYHGLEKTDSRQTLRRQFLLGLIAALSNGLGSDPLFELIAETASQKAKYLRGLWEAFGEGPLDLRSEASRRTFRLPTKLPNGTGGSERVPVRGFVNRYGGEWLKHIDPAGREHGAELFEEWKRSAESAEREGKSFPNYFYWLEGKSLGDLDFSLVRHKHYHNPEQRKVSFSPDGIAFAPLYSQKEAPHFIDPQRGDSDRRYHYMVDEKGDLTIHETGVHTGVNRGANAITAGMIEFRDGRIKYMDNNSGHYRPSKENLEAGIRVLKRRFGPGIFREDFKVKNHAPAQVDLLKSGASRELSLLSALRDPSSVELLEKIKLKRDFFDRKRGKVVSQAMTARTFLSRLNQLPEAEVRRFDQKIAQVEVETYRGLKWTQASEREVAKRAMAAVWTPGVIEVWRQVGLSLTKVRSFLSGAEGARLAQEDRLAGREMAYVLEKMDAAFLAFADLQKKPEASLEEIGARLKDLAVYLPSHGMIKDLPLFPRETEGEVSQLLEPLKELIGGFSPRVKLPFGDLESYSEIGSSFTPMARTAFERSLQFTPKESSLLRLVSQVEGAAPRELSLDQTEAYFLENRKREEALRDQDPLKDLRGFQMTVEDLKTARGMIAAKRGGENSKGEEGPP